jgi:hypothetical protein
VVEIDAAGLAWFKSSASNGTNGTCVEVADAGDRILVRSSRPRLRLSLSRAAWAAFVDQVRSGI